MFAHHQSNAAAAKGDDDDKSDTSNDERAKKDQGQERRGRSKSRGSNGKRSQTPGKVTVCISPPRVTGSRDSSPVAVASGGIEGLRSCMANKNRRSTTKPNRKIKFGKTEMLDRPVTGKMIRLERKTAT